MGENRCVPVTVGHGQGLTCGKKCGLQWEMGAVRARSWLLIASVFSEKKQKLEQQSRCLHLRRKEKLKERLRNVFIG